MVRPVILTLLVSSAALAQETMYRWVDENGVANYTNDLGSIPKKARASVTVTRGDEIGEVPTAHQPPAPVEKPAPVDAEKAKREQEEYDAWVRDEWIISFKNARD